MDTWSSVQGEARSTAGGWFAAAVFGVSAACGVSTSIASSLLAGVAVVDARPFFFGGIVSVVGVTVIIRIDRQIGLVCLRVVVRWERCR